jgi:transposase
MARKSPYEIELSAEARWTLEDIAAKYSSPYRDVVRAKIVLYAAQGLSNEAIAARIDLPRQIVSKWRKRFYEEGLPGLQERTRHGRPPLFSPRRRRGGQGTGL